MIDPFTQVYRKVVEALLAHPGLAQYIRPGNLIRYDRDDAHPAKTQVQDADLPELDLAPGELSWNPTQTSTDTRIVQVIELGLTTGSYAVALKRGALYPIVWEIMRALQGTLVNDLGLSFVKRTHANSPLAAGVTDIDDDRNRGKSGWVCVLQIHVEIFIPRATMLAEDPEL